MMRSLLFMILWIGITTILRSQEAGATISAGITNGYFSSTIFCQDCRYYNGRLLSVDARLTSGRLYFLLAADYMKSDHFPSQKVDYFRKEAITLYKGKGGLGFRVLKMSDKVYLTSKVLASFNILIDYNADIISNKGYSLNDGFMGFTSGIAFNFGALMLELEYEKGLINMFYGRPETKIDYFTLKTGVSF